VEDTGVRAEMGWEKRPHVVREARKGGDQPLRGTKIIDSNQGLDRSHIAKLNQPAAGPGERSPQCEESLNPRSAEWSKLYRDE
jgi:hypothetical protein